MERRYAVICNPAAAGGRGRRRLPAVVDELARRRVDHRVVSTRDIGHAREEARAAAAAGERVIAIGGDGLLRPVAAELRDSGSSLAIVPGGRGNDLARVLGIPTDPAAAARVALDGAERTIDMAAVDGEPFLGIASFGFDSDANRLANEAKLIRGNAVYLYAALRALASWRAAAFAVTVDGVRHELSGYSVAVANSQAYGGGMYIAPQASLDDGQLDVVATLHAPRWEFLSKLPKVFRGAHLTDSRVRALRGARIEVAADRPFQIYADGDPIGATPATIEVLPACLRVVVPR
ncbi:MAG: diacylglycerol kinase family lipid kinase [Solirubrobacterales bacterium]|nr:diacylglycerol kinase family lipid kinase [Solirubrobacterales bacterium]